MTPSPRKPAGALPALRLLPRGLVLLAAAAAGMALGGILARSGALALANLLDLGQMRERESFALFALAAGLPAGGFLAAWTVLRILLPPASPARLAAGAMAALAGLSLAVVAFLFVMTTPPPPAYPYLTVEIRLPAAEAQAVRLGIVAARERRPELSRAYRAAVTGGEGVLEAVFAMPAQAVGHLVLLAEGRERARFSLNLPPDPPPTLGYTPWLTSDQPAGPQARLGEAPFEMRFRIERRIVR